MERSAFIRLLAGLDDDIQESLGDDIYKAVQMHVVESFMIHHAWLIIIFQDIQIRGIDNVSTVTGKECGRKDLLTPLDQGRCGWDTVHIHIEVADQFIRQIAFSH